ncbi:uncharacterized protein LOC107035849 [Diachasma alloeum]|uniref:uncharacterized protein LOC107035849 n=1 Tax=Diachasma alloeum TaxID=454923 RepID=UPI00073824BE|nr:uncharacterized protein LOC107035849 [Diachasma alloeum]
MTPWLMAVFCLVTAGCLNVTDQQTSESTQTEQVAILKQIRKVNDDGSYTFGYEAGDGSFKVETRDVLGNVKGTFGFVDANGEIKRVTYSSSNGTGFKATTLSPLQEQVSVVQSIPRSNRSSSTRKPTVVYATSTESSSSSSSSAKPSSVVQTIPRGRKTTTTSSTTTSTTETPRPTYGHYKTLKNRPRYFINGQQRPPAVSVEEDSSEDSQINRPSTDEKVATYRRILFAKRPIDHNLRPITEEFEEKEEEPRASSGNALRRQLQEDTTKPEVQEVHEATDEHSDVYGGALSTTRPLFTTSSPPRILHRLRSERPKLYQVTPPAQENIGPARFDNPKYETTRSYEASTKAVEEREERESTPPIVFRPSTRIPDRDYARQTTESVYVRQPPEQILRDISSGLLVQQNMEEDGYRPTPVGRILYRPQPRAPIYPTTTDANVQYLTENPITEPDPPRAYIRPRPYARPLPYDPERPRPVLRPIDDREYDYSYRNIALPPEAPNPLPPPLSRRDFQILLRRLLISQYGPQALTYPRTYLEDALYDQTPYPTYQTGYQVPGRQALIYEPHITSNRYGDRGPLRPILPRPVSPIDPGLYQTPRYPDDYQDPRYMKRVYRQKFYTQEMADESENDGEEILPPPIREALLLRMLQLAIHNDRPVSMMSSSTTPSPSTPYKKSGPTRSVQIISDDDDKDVRKKM